MNIILYHKFLAIFYVAKIDTHDVIWHFHTQLMAHSEGNIHLKEFYFLFCP